MDKDCVFCKIAHGVIKAKRVGEGDAELERYFDMNEIDAIYDIAPQAPTHVVVFGRLHVTAVDYGRVIGELFRAAQFLATRVLQLPSYRLVTNIGPDAGQQVMHVHVHILGGKVLGPIG